MNRSLSEWQFQCFLQEGTALLESSSSRRNDVMEIDDQDDDVESIPTTDAAATTSYGASFIAGPPVESEEYLKSRLDLACAAVALTRASSVNLDQDEADTGTTENMDPKRVRKMISNRESAKRSRVRKQAHFTELETQNNEAAVDNRVLKADVETMRAKVKMAEETVKRVTGFNPVVQHSTTPHDDWV
ncbi:hypothetical protein L1987_81944 [Smallanthus sonchifolius]|uniref:Uncharacterized protein n=1 Tax=Smallanthus sonchifolius TaxID=185202 RepID=A0ACB8YSY3_9ASTR|nr:hypothetical protein L1987_81944 [Smallanthus sonchifolius]